jgi:outer membrane protein OmpA-like peptidoglycan-associated protein
MSTRAAVRFALRIGCGVSAALVLYGCSTSLPIAPIPTNELPPHVITAISVPPAEEIVPSTQKEEVTALVSEENNIFFALRSTSVDETEKEKLRRHAERLKLNRKESVLLIGHADGQGSRNYNIAITEERLVAVETLLRSYGVSIRQIRRSRSGSVKRTAQCSTNTCRQQMRRVELVFLQ